MLDPWVEAVAAGGHVELPAVPRTRHHAPVQTAFAERPAGVPENSITRKRAADVKERDDPSARRKFAPEPEELRRPLPIAATSPCLPNVAIKDGVIKCAHQTRDEIPNWHRQNYSAALARSRSLDQAAARRRRTRCLGTLFQRRWTQKYCSARAMACSRAVVNRCVTSRTASGP